MIHLIITHSLHALLLCLLQAQVEATEKLLSAEQAANAGLRAQTSELSSELGSVKEALADTAAQLEEERSSSNEMRSQLEAIKSEYITAGAQL
jgi:septal ring factor EnvC (AmiA/AmiB activator)